MTRLPPAELAVFQAALLQAALLQAAAPISTLAKQLKLRPHVVRRALRSLMDKKVLLGRRPYLNLFRLGFLEFLCFLSFTDGRRSVRASFLRALCEHEHVSFVAEVGGEYQYEIRILARNSTDVIRFLESLANQFGSKVTAPTISLVHQEEYSGVRLGSSAGNLPLRVLSYAPDERETVKIDELDHQVLSKIANGEQESFSEIARDLGAPVSTVAYRISMLEKLGVILGYYYLCDVKPFSMLPVVLLVEGKTLNAAQREELLKKCRNHRQLALIDILIGKWQARIMARVERQQDILPLVEELYQVLPVDSPEVKVLPQLCFHKCSPYPFRRVA